MKTANQWNGKWICLVAWLFGVGYTGTALAQGTIGTKKPGWMTFDFYGAESSSLTAKPINDSPDNNYSKILVSQCYGSWDTQSFIIHCEFSWTDYYGDSRKSLMELSWSGDTIFPNPSVSLANDRIRVFYQEWKNGNMVVDGKSVAIASYNGRSLADVWVRDLYPLDGDFVLRLIVNEKETPGSYGEAKQRTFIRGTFHLDN
jgi:hypothetical protein